MTGTSVPSDGFLSQTYVVEKTVSVKWMLRVMHSKRLVLTPIQKMCGKVYNES